jgi:hypothetical protein
MRLLAFAAILTTFGCLAQDSAPGTGGTTVIIVPVGTKIPLRLTSPLASKTAQTGDAVHAEAAFPVTVANHVAIPPGTYLEGVIDQVIRRGRHAGFTMHFTHMVYSNGYTVTLSGATAETRRAGLLPAGDPRAAAPAGPDGMAGGMALQQPTAPTVTQPSLPGPNKGVIIGLGVGSAAAAAITTVILARRGGDVYMRAGWRFEMVLADPLSLDWAKVSAAMANANPSPQ